MALYTHRQKIVEEVTAAGVRDIPLQTGSNQKDRLTLGDARVKLGTVPTQRFRTLMPHPCGLSRNLQGRSLCYLAHFERLPNKARLRNQRPKHGFEHWPFALAAAVSVALASRQLVSCRLNSSATNMCARLIARTCLISARVA